MNRIRVEVAYALPEEHYLVALTLPEGSTALDAVQRSGVLMRYPELDADNLSLGVFSQAVDAGHVLREGDRVEIYRPLLLDPKAARRLRAERARQRDR